MGSLVGHVAPGLAFFFLGFWHLFNQIKLQALHPNSTYTSLPWFPTSKIRHLELFYIMASCTVSIVMELFDNNFENSFISTTFFVYAALAILLDRTTASNSNRRGLTHLMGAISFAQTLLFFHLNSEDQVGVEGQYHMLLEIIICVSLATTLAGIGLPSSFLVSFVRSVSILSQGVWLVLMGFMLWASGLIPKGCFLHMEEGGDVVRCSSEEALRRAKSLVNIQFSWFLFAVTAFAVSFYVVLARVYGEKVEYMSLTKGNQEVEMLDDVESRGKSICSP